MVSVFKKNNLIEKINFSCKGKREGEGVKAKPEDKIKKKTIRDTDHG